MDFTQRASKQRRSHDAGADGCGVVVGRKGLVLSCGQRNFKDSYANELKARRAWKIVAFGRCDNFAKEGEIEEAKFKTTYLANSPNPAASFLGFLRLCRRACGVFGCSG